MYAITSLREEAVKVLSCSKFGMNGSAILKAEATVHTLYAAMDSVVSQREMGKQFWNHYVCVLKLNNKADSQG